METQQTLTSEHKVLETHLKKTTIISNAISLVIAIVASLGVVYGFYYNTRSKLQDHTNEIKEVKTEVVEIKNKMQDAAIFQGISKTEIKALQDKVSGIEKTVDKMDDKIDRLLIQTK